MYAASKGTGCRQCRVQTAVAAAGVKLGGGAEPAQDMVCDHHTKSAAGVASWNLCATRLSFSAAFP